MFENLREDWATYGHDLTRQGLWVMAVYRLGVWRNQISVRVLRLPFSFVYRALKLLSQILTGIELPCETKLGRRFRIDHFGGIIVSGDAVLGDDCIIRNGVTIGLRRTGQQGAPIVGNRVDIGSGAVLLGPIRIGDDVSIGANAVVINDVPPNSIAVGVPATVKAKNRSLPLLAACLLFGAAQVFAQPPVAGNSTLKLPPRNEHMSAPAEVIKQFEAPEMGVYTLDNGDQITVDVWGRAELSGRHLIGPDGDVTLPIAGSVALAGKTREQAEESVKNALSRYYSDLAVTIRVDQYASFRVMVLGRVGVPGALTFDRQPRLLDVLTKAAGLPLGGFGPYTSGLVRCAIFRGRDQVIWIDLKPLLGQGRMESNIRLARNDTVYLPDADDRLVYVLGYVRVPGAVHLTPTMSVLDALSLAGGPTEDASLPHMSFIRPSAGKQIEIPMKSLLEGAGKLNYSLEEGDIIYVPARGIAKFGYVLQKISSLTGFAIIGTIAKP